MNTSNSSNASDITSKSSSWNYVAPKRRVNGQDLYGLRVGEMIVYEYVHIAKSCAHVLRDGDGPGPQLRRKSYLILKVDNCIDDHCYNCECNFITDGSLEPRGEWTQSGWHGSAIVVWKYRNESAGAFQISETCFHWLGPHGFSPKTLVFKSLSEIFESLCPENFLTGFYNDNPWCQVRHSLSKSANILWLNEMCSLRKSIEVAYASEIPMHMHPPFCQQ